VNSEILGSYGSETAILTAVIPAKNLSINFGNILRVLEQPNSDQVHLVLVIDEPEDEAMRVKKTLENDSRFRKITAVYGEYNSPGTARNAGLNEVKTKWVTFWDSDDQPIISEVINTVDIANKSRSEIAIAGYVVESVSSGIQHFSTPFRDKKKTNLRNISLNPAIWRMSFLTELARQSSFPKLRMGEDQVFLSKLKMNDRRIYFSNKVSYVYRTENPGQLTSNKLNIKDLVGAFNLNVENLKENMKGTNCKFEIQLLAKEFLTLQKNRIVFAPLFTLLIKSNSRIIIRFAYELFILILTVLKKGRKRW
jgi:glycosyltransferase involved in cell wall biosynthesis